MRNKYILIGLVGVVVGVLLASVAVVLAGQIDSPAGPTATGGQMYTLEQTYDRLNDGTAATKMTTFTEPSSGPASTMHDLDDVYDLVGERAQVPKTGAGDISGYTEQTGEDSLLQKGVAWPNPRFTDNGDGTVTDNLTGLIWLKNANCTDMVGGVEKDVGTLAWANDALTWSNNLANGDCGLSDGSTAGDWRLPNVRELQSLVHYGCNGPALPDTAGTGCGSGPFTGVQTNQYWSSTTDATFTESAWFVALLDGYVSGGSKADAYYVWPVRGGQ